VVSSAHQSFAQLLARGDLLCLLPRHITLADVIAACSGLQPSTKPFMLAVLH
jgi:hypothetical protein